MLTSGFLPAQAKQRTKATQASPTAVEKDKRPDKQASLDLIYSLLQKGEIYMAWQSVAILALVYPEDPSLGKLAATLDRDITRELKAEYGTSEVVRITDLNPGDQAIFSLLNIRWQNLKVDKTLPEQSRALLKDLNGLLARNPNFWEGRFMQAYLSLTADDAISGRQAGAAFEAWGVLENPADPELFRVLLEKGWMRPLSMFSDLKQETAETDPARAKYEEVMRKLRELTP